MAEETQAEKPETARPNVKMVPNPSPVDELYVDGIAGLISRRGVIKLDLYRVVGVEPETKTELRQVSHRLVFPAAVVPELHKVFQAVARAAQPAAEKAGADGGGLGSPLV